MKTYTNRVLVSFQGKCPLECKHCYTLDHVSQKNNQDIDEIEQIISSIRGMKFDIIYVSHDRENFIDEQAGLQLAESLYETFHKSILIITRKCLCQDTIVQLANLRRKMEINSHYLFVAVSIPANSSYGITEKIDKISTPEARCELLKSLHKNGINSILLARPLFPNAIIPTEEIIELITRYHNYIDAVVASGLAINNSILDRLGMNEKDFKCLPGNNDRFLIGSSAKDIKYIDVSAELSEIDRVCNEYGIVFSNHSMDALNKIQRNYCN